MPKQLSLNLSETIERELPHLRELTDDQALLPRGSGKWCPKEELGHLIDSAANNHIRFVRAALEPEFQGPGYAQDEWVRLHGYRDMPWHSIVDFWFHYNRLLTRVVESVPVDRLETQCVIASHPPVTLRFLIEDYTLHMQHHIDQLLRRDLITAYPSMGTSV